MRVSVIVATYGDRGWADLADRAAASADGQGAHEIIVLHRDDGTLAEVRNEAAAAATGDWLCHLDADDRLDPGYLDAMRTSVDSLNAVRGMLTVPPPPLPPQLLVPSVSYIRDNGTHTEPGIPSWGRPLREINCAVIGTLIQRDLFLKIGGFREWPLYEDWDMTQRAVLAGAVLTPVWGAVYRAHVRHASRNTPTDPDVANRAYRDIRQSLTEAWDAWETAHGPQP